MKILFENVTLISGEVGYALVDGKYFAYVGTERPDAVADIVKNCSGKLLIPALYNTHCHVAMNLFRGIGDDLPLDRWLNEKIFPAEDKLTRESVYAASLLGAAEMIRGGVVSFSDMYMFEDATAEAVLECGMKANLSRGFVSFDESIDTSHDSRFLESVELYKNYNGRGDGRVKVEMSLHAEYTNVLPACRYMADYCKQNSIPLQIHLSETLGEHERCIEKYGKTPTEFFESAGVLDTSLTAAHAVWVSDSDIDILAERGVNISHNPTSNLKLGSGVMPYEKMRAKGINISLGTDGAASNNTYSILKEMQIAALIHKGVGRDAAAASAKDILYAATRAGALAQGRADCGKIEAGYRADALILDLDAPNTLPARDLCSTVVYGADRTNVALTMCDGRILFENGEYKSIDIERAKHEFLRLCTDF